MAERNISWGSYGIFFSFLAFDKLSMTQQRAHTARSEKSFKLEVYQFSLLQWFSTRNAPPTRRHLVMSRYVFDFKNRGCYWHLMGRNTEKALRGRIFQPQISVMLLLRNPVNKEEQMAFLAPGTPKHLIKKKKGTFYTKKHMYRLLNKNSLS